MSCQPIELHMQAYPIDTWYHLSIHQSQFTWYRKLFVLFSKYSFCNSFTVFEK
jgi:hypothetical protein